MPVYNRVTSRTARAPERGPVSKNQKERLPQSLLPGGSREGQDWTRLPQCLLTSMPFLQGVCIHFLSLPLPCLHVCYSLQPKSSPYCNPIPSPSFGMGVCLTRASGMYAARWVCGGTETEAVTIPLPFAGLELHTLKKKKKSIHFRAVDVFSSFCFSLLTLSTEL